ncbi:MAG: hypothetical protein CMK36_08090 [Porticoccaceae bacterium]|nr:hypothetical protein [Porticoccaceae bacterium]|tara:strand:+ start:407 stop:1648 length:1242 start_codon:yes stop_codon:yes gene_type:complete
MKRYTIYALRLTATVLSLSLSLFQANAQDSSHSYTQKAPRESRISGDDATSSFSALSPALRESTPLQIGPLLFTPSVNYRYTDASNLLRRVGNEQDSEIQNISFNLFFDYQELWSFSYRPAWTYYSNAAFDDTDSHSANFFSDFAVADWRIGFNQTYDDSKDSLVQTGSQTQQETFGTTLSASRQLNSTWYLDLSADQDLRSTSRFSDVSEWSTSGWLRHQASSIVNSSIGLTWGYTDVDPGLNTEYMRFLLRFGFNPSEKLRASLLGGIDSREIDAPGFDKEENPTYNASLQYQPFDYTTIGINLSRSIRASYFSNFNNETEALTLSLNQRLLGRFNLTVSYGEQSSDYLGLLSNFVVGRADEYDSFSVNLSTQLVNRINVSAFYRKNENSTNTTGFGFSSDQSGFSIGYRY